MSQNPGPYDRPDQGPVHGQQPPQYVPQSMQHEGGASFPPVGPPPGSGYGSGAHFNAQVPEKKPKNVMGIVAFAVAIVGFIFACIPGALIVGWILLPIAFLLAIISFFLKGGKGLSIAALIISVVGTIVAFLVFFFVVASAFDSAFNDEVTGEAPAGEFAEQPGEGEGEGASSGEGSRETPFPLGTTVKSDEWEVTIKDVTLDATDEVMGENQFNEEPASGNQYMLVDVEVKYVGSDPAGAMPMFTIDYVSPGGNTFSGADSSAVAPDEIDQFKNLYEGASTSGTVAIQVPSEDVENGVLAVSPDFIADTAFVAVK